MTTLTALNFEAARVPLDAFLDLIAAHLDDATPPSFYIGSTDVDTYLPGLRVENDLAFDHEMFARNPPIVEHLDRQPHHRRRPLRHVEQHRLLRRRPAPLHAVSARADRRISIRARSSRRRAARSSAWSISARPISSSTRASARRSPPAQVAELEPGDVLFYPALWWHQVEALDAVQRADQLLVEHARRPSWTRRMNTLLHALLSLRDRPEPERSAWRALFDYYVFGPAGQRGGAPAGACPRHARAARRDQGAAAARACSTGSTAERRETRHASARS